jgi:hypothetical protein
MLAPRLGAGHRLAFGQSGNRLLDPSHCFAGVLNYAISQRMHNTEVVLRQSVTAQSGFPEKRCAASKVRRTTGAVHKHRAQVALRTGMPGIGRDPVKAARQHIIAGKRRITCFEPVREFENCLRFDAGWRKLWDRRDDMRTA